MGGREGGRDEPRKNEDARGRALTRAPGHPGLVMLAFSILPGLQVPTDTTGCELISVTALNLHKNSES